jgi:hypothetical protein
MPRAKKPYGTAVDRRNGEQAQLAAQPLRRFTLPRRSDGLDYDPITRRMWRELFDDTALASVIRPVDRQLVIRWAQSVDDWIKAEATARQSPVAKGSMGQEVASPHYVIAAQAMTVITECERQLGIGALNRARLGLILLAEQSSLADLAARIDNDAFDEPDPRLGLLQRGLHRHPPQPGRPRIAARRQARPAATGRGPGCQARPITHSDIGQGGIHGFFRINDP